MRNNKAPEEDPIINTWDGNWTSINSKSRLNSETVMVEMTTFWCCRVPSNINIATAKSNKLQIYQIDTANVKLNKYIEKYRIQKANIHRDPPKLFMAALEYTLKTQIGMYC